MQNHRESINKAKSHKDHAGLLPWVNPIQENYAGQLEKMLERNLDVIKGFKLHPSSEKYDVSVSLLSDSFALASKYGLIVATYTDAGRSGAGKFAQLLRKYPNTKLILYHALPAEECLAMVNSFQNLYIDTSHTAFSRDVQQTSLAQIGKERILFGLDSPLGFPIKAGGCNPTIVMPRGY